MAERAIATRIIRVDPRSLKLLDRNAHFMKPEMFERLVANVRRDGELTSVPFAVLDRSDGTYEVLSGNHRTKAAIKAGLAEIDVKVTDDELTKDERLAIQLSHNSLNGQDDPVLLAELWAEIGTIEAKDYAGFDDRALEALAKVTIEPLRDVALEFRRVSFMFLPPERDRAAEALEQAKGDIGDAEAWLARIGDYDRLLKALAEAGNSHNLRNTAVGLMVILDIFEAHRTDLAEGWQEASEPHPWVPLSSIVGKDEIPLEAAKVLRQAVERMVGRGEVSAKAPWQALEFLAAEWLSGDNS